MASIRWLPSKDTAIQRRRPSARGQVRRLVGKVQARSKRLSPSKRGYGRQWRVLREYLLSKEPFCRNCSTDARPVPASECDHIIPHRGDGKLFYDAANIQPLCRACHLAKTARGE